MVERPPAAEARAMTRIRKPRGAVLTADARRAGWEARRKQADARAAEVAPIIAGLWAAGVTSVGAIARALNERGVRTATGKVKWYAVQVRHALARLK